VNKWKEVLVSPLTPIREAIQKLDASALQIVLVVDDSGCLLGTITDGDIRRGILKGLPLSEPVKAVMNSNPIVAKYGDSREEIFSTMKRRSLHHMPIVDELGCVKGLELMDQLIQTQKKENRIVLMAGGMGNRLRPLTEDCPKPMLKVGNKPLLETILENFIEQGFYRFYMSVNFKADVVRDYFQDGSRWGVNIQYLHENQRLGTAGALSLLAEVPSEPIFVMNGDLLTKVNFNQLLNFHDGHQAVATMCVREYNYQIPYGVVRTDRHHITSIDEKPVQRFFVNAGIYVLDPEVLKYVAQNSFLDMPTLFERLMEQQKVTAAFPIREYWLDIGHMADYDRANGEYLEVFS
jgi:dTDP-glucose pyrophosphorylase